MARSRTSSVRQNLLRFLSVRSAFNPTYSSDDKKLIYLSDMTGVPQVWSVDIEGGAPQQLTYYEDRVGVVSGAKKKDAFVFTKDHGGDENFQLFLMEKGAGELQQLTDDPEVIHDFSSTWTATQAGSSWSPTEDSILFSSNARNRAFFDVYTMALSTKRVKRIHRSDYTNYGIDWSTDGKNILVFRAYAPFNQDLFLVGTRDHDVRCLTEHKGEAAFFAAAFSRNGRQIYVVTDEGREFASPAVLELDSPKPQFLMDAKWDVEELALSDDRKRLAFTRNVDGLSKLTIWEPPGPQVIVQMPPGYITGLRWSHKGEMLAFVFSSPNHNPDIWLHSLRDGSTKRVTRSSASGLNLERLPSPKLVRYPSFDGLSIPCFIYRAKNSSRPPPAVVYIHGGPEWQFRPEFYQEIGFYVSMGLTVIAPNVRGSTGYGRTYTHLDDVRLRMNSVRDIESLVAQLKRDGEIDGNRVGVLGGSYGGFMVLACMYRYPKLWAAGVDVVGISNFVTFLENTGPWRRKLREAEYGDPAKDRDFLESISPLNNASKITAPLFMIHGTNDPRVPLNETNQIEGELKRLGREVEVMVFDDEGHGLIKLKNKLKGYTAAFEFLLDHLSAGD
ncbi:MAG TPA: S9 family peptidase [Nitrososphaerales archaeon]|nr:S9 family peptidase [Nitrososphaerales archaeon]